MNLATSERISIWAIILFVGKFVIYFGGTAFNFSDTYETIHGLFVNPPATID